MNVRHIPSSALIGMAVIAIILVAALAAPLIAPFGAEDVPGAPWEASSHVFLLGTDNIGRDIFSRLLYGGRTTLFVSLVSTSLSFAIGVTLAFLAAVSGGIIDQVLSRTNDLLISLPGLIVALIVLAVMPQSIFVLIGTIALIEGTKVYRVAYAVAISLNAMEYIEAAWIRGENRVWIIFREILPNATATLLSEFGLRFAYSILFIAALSFLGLGIQPPTADWGGMVRDNKDGIIFGISAALYPGVAISILVISLNLVVNWLTDLSTQVSGEGRNV